MAQGRNFSFSNNFFTHTEINVIHCANSNLQKLLTLSQMINFSPFQFKASTDDNFKLDENGRKFSNQVENTVGKGEIARYEQFLLFPQCFQKACTADT